MRRVCDIRPEAAAWVGQLLGCPWTIDHAVLVDDPEIDAVVITTPEFLHAEQTIAAVEAGKHVLCEKPMGRILQEADTMLAAADATGAHFMVARSRRFTARYLRPDHR